MQSFREIQSQDICLDIFGVEPAGSTATQTKVNNPDEYDFNLMIRNERIVVDDSPKVFHCVTGNSDLRENWSVKKKPRGIRSPPGYATIYVNTLGGNRYIFPRFIQESLYREINEALEADSRENVTVSTIPHGPAIYVLLRRNYHKKPEETIEHDIDVDFTVAIKVDKQQIPIDIYGWPSEMTKECLPQQTIDRILDAGVYLVPKDNSFWYISFSNPAKILMRSIDTGDTCRKKCHKILKTDFLEWNSQGRFPGISTFIFKHQLFWFNEELNITRRENYWRNSNIGRCYIDMLQHLSNCLKTRYLSNYFNVDENILETKDIDVLDELSEQIQDRITQLESIYSASVNWQDW